MFYRYAGYKKSFKDFINYNPKIFSNLKMQTHYTHYELYLFFSKLFDKVGNKSCLVKALSFKCILSIYNIDSNMKVGFRKKNNSLLGHAWIEVNDIKLQSKYDDNDNYFEIVHNNS